MASAFTPYICAANADVQHNKVSMLMCFQVAKQKAHVQSSSTEPQLLAQLETQTNEAHHEILSPTTRAAEVKRLWPLRTKESRSSGHFGFQRLRQLPCAGSRKAGPAAPPPPTQPRPPATAATRAAANPAPRQCRSLHIISTFQSCGFRLDTGTAAMPAAATPAPRLRRCLRRTDE